MPDKKLPERASLQYLKKLAKERLQELRHEHPKTKLSAAQLAIAREYGFANWRALKAEIDRRQTQNLAPFFEACVKGNVAALRRMLAGASDLVRASRPGGYEGWTGLHSAAQNGHLDAVRLLLQHGADPNAREEGDNTSPLHWAAAHEYVDVVRALLDAGADVHGVGDLHELDVIGWAAYFHAPGGDPTVITPARREVVGLLVQCGARHHVFSAVSLGDLDLIRDVVRQNPKALERRMSRFENGQTPLHFAIHRKRYDILDLLIELGADLEAADLNGRTALEAAMLAGDTEAMHRLQHAGANPPQTVDTSNFETKMSKLAKSVTKGIPMIYVPDVGRALDWYTSIGFKEINRYDDGGVVNFGMVSFGKAEIMLNLHGKAGAHDASLWFYTDHADELYQLLKSRQLVAVQEALASGSSIREEIHFEEDINNTFYGARQFAIRDPDGYILYFIGPAPDASAAS